MTILEFLGLKREDLEVAQAQPDGPETETVRKIIAQLDQLEPEKARYIAAFAYILSRVAHADLGISEEETREMERIVKEQAGLAQEEAILVVQMAKTQNRLFGGTENFLVTREFNKIASRDQKIALLHCLFAVSSSDKTVSVIEESEIRQIASELKLQHKDFIDVRLRYRRHLAVLKQD